MNRYLETLNTELTQALDGLDLSQTQLRPWNDISRWNIQQIAGHLRLTYTATVEAMDSRIAKASATRAKPSAMQYLAQFALIRIGYFPRGRKAPGRVTASLDECAATGSNLARELEIALSLMDARIDHAETIFGSHRRVINHMVLGPLSIDQWRKFHLIHGRHHIKQIMAIRREHEV
jgi:hypothetical protein